LIGKFKILLLGSNYDWSVERSYLNALKEKQVDCDLYALQNIFYDYYYASLYHKIIFRLGLSSVLKKINKDLALFVEQYAPTHIWVFKGMEVLPNTLQEWKSKGIKLINYNPDNPFIFTGSGSGNKNITNSINLYDWYLSYDSTVVKQLLQMNIHSSLFPFAIDMSTDFNFSKSALSINKIAFIGNPDQERIIFLNQLANLKIPIDVYGHNWNKLFSLHKGIKVHDALDKVAYQQLVPKYRAVLNLMRIHNLDSHNMRSLEIPAYGGVQLASRTKDHVDFFEDGKEIFLFSDVQEAAWQWHHIRELSIENLQKGINSAQDKLRLDHSYGARINFFLNGLEQLCK
jgi:spore maturation protein CgeB